MHTFEGIGLYGNRTMSETAATLGITTGTLTVAIDGLMRKGYVERRDQNDRRVVPYSLTKKASWLIGCTANSTDCWSNGWYRRWTNRRAGFF